MESQVQERKTTGYAEEGFFFFFFKYTLRVITKHKPDTIGLRKAII